jgi:hypothetical protein
MDVVLDGRISQSVLPSLAMPVLPKPTLSPVPPVLSGADQARFSPQLSYFAAIGSTTRSRLPDAVDAVRALGRAAVRRLTLALLVAGPP